MTKKQLQHLIDQSYNNAVLDRNKISAITKKLNRAELKMFMKALRLKEQENNVYITLPNEPDRETEMQFSNLFPSKKIVYNVDPDIRPGLRINFGDLLYEVSLKDRLNKLISYIERSYD